MNTDKGTTALTIQDLREDVSAGPLFREVLTNQKGQRSMVLAIFRQDPATALATLSRGSEVLGLTVRGSADALEAILGAVGDDDVARTLIKDSVSHPRLVEMLHARGDLESVAAGIADPETILEAILNDVSSIPRGSIITSSLVLRSWAFKLSQRPDYQEILHLPIMEQPFLHWVVAAIWYENVHRQLARTQEDEEDLEVPPEEAPDDEDQAESDDWNEMDEMSDDELDEEGPDSENLRSHFIAACTTLEIDPEEAWALLQQLKSDGRLEDADPDHLRYAWDLMKQHSVDVENAPHLIAQVSAEKLDF